MKSIKYIVGFVAMLLSLVSYAETEQSAVQYLQKQWAIDNYQLSGKVQNEKFESLIQQADQRVLQYPQSAEIYIWRGIIKSSFAGVKGGLGGLKYAKEAKTDLEKGLELNPNALQGSAYTSLGTLYFNVPGWPLGFGDDEKAEKLLKKALTINPKGIDPNYFYADYLRSEKRYHEAKAYMEIALQAAPRPERPLADQGRIQEIKKALLDIEKHL